MRIPGRTLTTKRRKVRLWRKILPLTIHRSINQPTDETQADDNRSGEIAIGTVEDHQRNSLRYLYRARANLDLGKTGPASIAIRRSASHAVTAAAVHWHFRAHTKRRLAAALRCIVHDLGLPPGHLITFSQVYSFTPDFLDSIGCRSALLVLTRLRRRVRRLADDLNRAINANPDPPDLQHVISQIRGEPLPSAPSITTLGELRRLTGEPLDDQYVDHPLDCPDCSRASRDPAVVDSFIFSLSRPPCLAIQLIRPSNPTLA